MLFKQQRDLIFIKQIEKLAKRKLGTLAWIHLNLLETFLWLLLLRVCRVPLPGQVLRLREGFPSHRLRDCITDGYRSLAILSG